MKVFYRLSLLIPLLLIAPVSSNDVSVSTLPSLEWQKQALDKNIRNIIQTNLSSIIKSNEYMINIEILSGIPETPDFYTSESDLQKEDTAAGRVTKAEEVALEQGISVEEAEAKLKKEEEQKLEEEKAKEQESNSQIKFSNEEPDETTENYIIFSKLGMEAPLVDDFNDFRPDGKIILSMDPRAMGGQQNNDAEKMAELREKQREEIERIRQQFKEKEEGLNKELDSIKNATREPSLVEQTWKYNRSIDIFSNLRSVTITVVLNEKLAQLTRDSVERILNNLTFSLGSVKPKISIEYVPMDEVKNESTLMADLMEMVKSFSTAIGMILASLILGVIGFVLLKKFLESSKEAAASQMNMSGKLDSDAKVEEEAEGNSAGAGGAAQADGESENVGFNGMERFQAYMQKSKMDACMLVKKWIKLNDTAEQNALRALVQQLDNSVLVDIFSILTEDEKSSWKSLLSAPLGKEGLSKANLFISNQIVEEIILPSVIVDAQACDLLLKIQPEQAAKMIAKNVTHGAILMNVMSTKFVNQVLEHLPTKLIDSVVEASIEFSSGDIQENLEEFKKSLEVHIGKSLQIPFLQKVRELLPHAAPSRETSLYKALAMSGDRSSMLEFSSKRLPAELIGELPENLIKTMFSRYPIADRVEFLLSRSEDERDFYLGLVAPEGSKAADLIDLEFQSAENNIVLQRKIRDEKDKIYNKYVEYVRSFIKNDKSFDGQIEALVHEWVDKRCTGVDANNVTEIANVG